MTALVPDALEPSMVAGSREAQRRLDELTHDRRGRAGWWVEVTRQLDTLAESVRTVPGDMVDLRGFTEQIRTDAPHLMGRWIRVASEQDALSDAVAEVRMLASRSAGDPAAVAGVSDAIHDLLGRLRRFQERTTDVLLDASERDMGGE
jgi:hypothetical protein